MTAYVVWEGFACASLIMLRNEQTCVASCRTAAEKNGALQILGGLATPLHVLTCNLPAFYRPTHLVNNVLVNTRKNVLVKTIETSYM